MVGLVTRMASRWRSRVVLGVKGLLIFKLLGFKDFFKDFF